MQGEGLDIDMLFKKCLEKRGAVGYIIRSEWLTCEPARP